MVYAGLPAAPSRAALAATIAPLTGAAADEMWRATARAERALRPDAKSGLGRAGRGRTRRRPARYRRLPRRRIAHRARQFARLAIVR